MRLRSSTVAPSAGFWVSVRRRWALV